MNDKLLVLGTIAYDSIETPNIKTGKILGGCATYIGLAASKFKTNCCLVSIVGEDFDKSHINLLESKKLDLSGVEIVDNEKTFFWKGKYHENLNKRTTLETQLNVLTKFYPKIPKNFLDSSIVVLGNVDPNIQLAVLDQIEQPKLIVMDTMNFWIESYRDKLNELIKKVDLISINDEEALQLTNCQSTVEAAYKIQNMGPKFVIIKKGENGALLISKDNVFSLPSLPLKKFSDPTGAGDSFIGGVVGYLSQFKNISFDQIKGGVVIGSCIASFTVQEFGTKALEEITVSQLEQRIKDFKLLTEFEIMKTIFHE